MGELADEMVEGISCCLCGAYFCEGHDANGDPNTDKDGNVLGHYHGYPAVCWECWEDLSKRQRKEYQKASKPTI